MNVSTSPLGLLRAWLCLAALALALSCVACATKPEIPSQPMNKGVNLSGQWYSPQYEKMILEHRGDTVRGEFSYKSGGVLEGTLQGNVLYFTWEQPGDFAVARRDVGGKGYFIFSPDGTTFTGRWGYEEELDSGGAWDGERVIDDSDKVIDGPVF